MTFSLPLPYLYHNPWIIKPRGGTSSKWSAYQHSRQKGQGFDSWVGRSPGEGNGNRLQYSCVAKSMDRGAWWARVHGAAKSRAWLSNEHTFKGTLMSAKITLSVSGEVEDQNRCHLPQNPLERISFHCKAFYSFHYEEFLLLLLLLLLLLFFAFLDHEH